MLPGVPQIDLFQPNESFHTLDDAGGTTPAQAIANDRELPQPLQTLQSIEVIQEVVVDIQDLKVRHISSDRCGQRRELTSRRFEVDQRVEWSSRKEVVRKRVALI